MLAESGAPLLVRGELTPAEAEAPLDFAVALKLRDADDLKARVRRGEIVSSKEMREKYLPAAADVNRVRGWLVSQGFTVQPSNGPALSVFARGSINQIQRAFATTFGRVRAAGIEYTSALTAPSLPETVASSVLSINGLQPHLRPVVHSRRFAARPQALTGNGPPYTVSAIARAYNVSSGDGSGQVLGIVINTFPADNDLTSFWAGNGINQSLGNIEKVQVVPGVLPAPSGEESLDVEWSSGMAPGAKVRVYATTDLGFVHLDAAYQEIINELPNQPGLHQISLSYGLGETYASAGQMNTDSNYFLSITGAGVTVFVSAGDGGSSPGASGHDHSGPVQPETPANDPSVTAVGGTSLYTDPTTGTVSRESAWYDGGGGISAVFSRPAWQTGPGVPAGDGRLVPDVSLVADPATGGYVTLQGQVIQYGGTSWGAPTWAAICARMNQLRAQNGETPLGLLGPKLYPSINTDRFRDVTTGSNGPDGKYNAGAGYDLCTGIGVPEGVQLVQALASSTSSIGADKDFDGDGQADLLWQNTSTGQLVVWRMKNGTMDGRFVLNGMAPPWRVAGIGDFNGDGYSDVVWENGDTGQHLIWLLKNGVYTASQSLPALPAATIIVGVGDFAGDGNADLLLENTQTGEHLIWFLNRGVFNGTSLSLGALPAGFQVAGVADFNGDGQADVVLENPSTGEHVVWILNKGAYVRSIDLPQRSLQWRAAGAADFNGDGKADIVWNNLSTGEHEIWVMNGADVLTRWSLPVHPVVWQIQEH